MHTTANALLAAGASPLMAHAPEEMDDMVRIASALVLNIGTLDSLWILSMRQAGRFAAARGIPTVLDPVGAGASALRTDTALTLLRETHPSVVRGNASEIMALVDAGIASKGVDSLQSSSAAISAARTLAETYGCVVSVSGETDLITNGTALLSIKGGSHLMTRVTGMGCTATAITAACVAGAKTAKLASPALAGAAAAMALMAEAGDRATASANGPGSFLTAFLDALYAISPEELPAHLEEIQALV